MTRTIASFEYSRYRGSAAHRPALILAATAAITFMSASSGSSTGFIDTAILAAVFLIPVYPSLDAFRAEQSEGMVEALLATGASPVTVFLGKLLGTLAWSSCRGAIALSGYASGKMVAYIVYRHVVFPFGNIRDTAEMLAVFGVVAFATSTVQMAQGMRLRRNDFMFRIALGIAMLGTVVAFFLAPVLLSVLSTHVLGMIAVFFSTATTAFSLQAIRSSERVILRR